MSLAQSKWRVIRDHAAESSVPLRVRAGDVLGFERRPTEWQGWIWCADPRGHKGWVPENWVAIEGDTCKMKRDYTSLELAVRRGEVLVVHETESGWAWAARSYGEKGWVPLECIEKLPAEHVWYAGYGSNLSRQRFLCYILGGKPALGSKDHEGSKDHAPPTEDRILTVKHRLYFALPEGSTGTENWGPGGVAFIDTESDESAETICRMWRITGEQYADVRRQEGLTWYDKEIALGEADGIPILTVSHGRRLKHTVTPSPAYLKTIATGLKETAGLSTEEIAIYLLDKAGIEGGMRKHEITGVLADLA